MIMCIIVHSNIHIVLSYNQALSYVPQVWLLFFISVKVLCLFCMIQSECCVCIQATVMGICCTDLTYKLLFMYHRGHYTLCVHHPE